MDQSNRRECYERCAVCSQSFRETSAPFLFCRNAHLCCPTCLSFKSSGYEYASFPCPLCLQLVCKATAVHCEWLPKLLSRLEIAEKRAARCHELIREIDELKIELQNSQNNQIQLRRRIAEVERRKHKFSESWRKALFSIASKKNADGSSYSYSNELKSFEKYPSKLISEMERLSEENRKMSAVIEQLKKQNIQLSNKVSALQSDKDALQLNWSGTYTKPVDLAGRPGRQMKLRDKDRELPSTPETPAKKIKIDNYLTSNIMEIFKQKVKNAEQPCLEKRSDSKGKTYKKFLNMKIEQLDERFNDANPKLTQLNSNLKKLREVLEVSCRKKRTE